MKEMLLDCSAYKLTNMQAQKTFKASCKILLKGVGCTNIISQGNLKKCFFLYMLYGVKLGILKRKKI